MRKKIEEWVQEAIRQGWTVVPNNSAGAKHWKLRTPGGVMVTLPSTPGGHPRGILNARAALRRAGLKI